MAESTNLMIESGGVVPEEVVEAMAESDAGKLLGADVGSFKGRDLALMEVGISEKEVIVDGVANG